MITTNYINTFIVVAPDSQADRGTEPPDRKTIAGLQHALLVGKPYSLTSDEILFKVHRQRKNITRRAEIAKAREEFFAKPQACLRASALAKQYGWGVHHDKNGKVAIYGVDTEEYRRLSTSEDIKVLAAMRNQRG